MVSGLSPGSGPSPRFLEWVLLGSHPFVASVPPHPFWAGSAMPFVPVSLPSDVTPCSFLKFPKAGQ